VRETVKCRSLLVALAFLTSGVGTLGTARAQLLLGGGGPHVQKGPAPLDPRLPLGASQIGAPRPAAGAPTRACSFRRPVCVHSSDKIQESAVQAWLVALEAAHERLVGALGLPPPLPDDGRGGSAALDVYLVPGGDEVRVELDERDLGAPYDAASAFCVAGERALPAPRGATLCLAEAIVLGLHAAETPFTRRALAEDLWLAAFAPSSADAEAIDDAQAAPEHAVLARERSRFVGGGTLLAEYLDGAKGRGEPAAVALASTVLAAKARSPVALRFTNEPDTVDVLRSTFGPSPIDVAKLFGDFAVARAFLGSRDVERAFPALAWAGDLARVRFEWSVPFTSLPRRLAPVRPVEPTGATYLWLSLDAASKDDTLIFQADWEPPVSFRWALVLVGADGRARKRIDPPFLERDTHVERVVSDLEGAAGVLIVGTNLGGLGPTYPFDPDFEPYEPHGYTVYLGKQ
jgi:hypothetical protein